MTTLLSEPLYTELSHVFNFSNQRYSLGCIAPYIYMHNAPAGTFKISLFKGVSLVFEKEFTSVELKTALETTNNYAHVFIPIIPDDPIQLTAGTYTVKLAASGYTYSNSSFIGWIRQHENLNNALYYTPMDDNENPLALRIKVFKRAIE